jgi:3-deoxy-manno-octulosonate cytidylyltransferase (CMP-KDO synthetase)
MEMTDTVLAVIPARYDSSRFPGKPLASILGKPMIEWVIQGVSEADLVDEILVATDDDRIYQAVEPTEAEPVMTSSDITSGSDRVSAAVRDREGDIIVNVQGDEPLIEGSLLDRGIEEMKTSPNVPMGSYMAPADPGVRDNPDVVQVVVDNQNRALYFSRAPIPYDRGDSSQTYQHVGIYLFRKSFLHEYSSMDSTPLERAEKLEQLRALENGKTIKMIEMDEPTVGVDRPEDLERVEDILDVRESSGEDAA